MIQKRLFYLCTTVSLAGWLILLSILGGCQSNDHRGAKQQPGPKNPSVQFADSVHADYAEGFRITYHNNYKMLEILKPFQDQVDTLRYSLVPREIVNSIDIENTTEIPIPVESILATSTTQIALAEALEAVNVIRGMVGADYIYSKAVREGVKSGDIVSLPRGELNKEVVLAMHPDLLMVSGGPSSNFDNIRMLMDSDINVTVISEWLETTPLGKAEWIKVLAALLNKEELANKKFAVIEQKYNHLKAVADSGTGKPMVINNMPYKGAWFVSGGESYLAQYLRDAGADYPWFDSDETGGLRKSFEVIYEIGLEADIWIHPGAATSKEDILAKDSRFRDFKAFKTGEIYNNNRRMSPSGGNDFWESGVVHPEIVLADLIKIFHPQLLPDHELYYYQKID